MPKAGGIGVGNDTGEIIGGLSVIFHGFIRATRDSDLLVPDGEDSDEAIRRFFPVAELRRLSDGGELGIEEIAAAELRVNTRRGIVDILRGADLPSLCPRLVF